MTQAASVAETKLALATTQTEPSQGGTIAAFASPSNFEAAQRMAKALSSSSLVPKEYLNNLPNCLIAMELAARIGVSVFAAMQNLDIIHGRPSWRSQFLIATVNSSGRFTPIRFRFQGEQGTAQWGCRAVARDRDSNEECVGPLITMALAKAEGWSEKSGSKWKTLPELMLSYRAAAFWTRIYAPELSLGMHTVEEVRDVDAVRDADLPGGHAIGKPADLEAQLLDERAHDPETGEVAEPPQQREPGED